MSLFSAHIEYFGMDDELGPIAVSIVKEVRLNRLLSFIIISSYPFSSSLFRRTLVKIRILRWARESVNRVDRQQLRRRRCLCRL